MKFGSAVSLLVAAFLGMSAASASAQGWPEQSTPEFDSLLAEARAERQVIIFSTQDLTNAFLESFERDTGIQAIQIIGNRSEGLARFTRETEAELSSFDVYIGGRRVYELVEEGKLVAIAPQLMLPEVTDLQNWRDSRIAYVDAAEQFAPLPSHFASGFVLVNTNLVDPTQIRNWSDLLKPEFKGKIASHDPGIRGSGLSVGIYLAEVMGEDFLKDLFQGQEMARTSDYRQVTDWVARGTYPIALGALSRDIENYVAEGVDWLQVVKMEDGPGYLSGGAAVMAIPTSTPHSAAAMVFANWYLSKAGQTAFSIAYQQPSDRLDVPNGGWPDYVVPLAGVHYIDQYNETWTRENEGRLVDIVNRALGQ